ncbi:phage tail family protein [Acinetobacter wuhouensis]|uniref:Uncharacterized protein n=1 Tax=Acinetobacter wuhouensis TaxID=1879050 RepID=A0A4Q7AR15_9GAMM|nr:hypothetical protein [Acinetobacter wuhouensis]RZG48063.1 hypothetical protein EXU28_04655 [Acinetobacter wuhouensis]
MANEVEVKITASTDKLSEGMKESEKIVDKSAKNIEEIGKKVVLMPDTTDVKRVMKDAEETVEKSVKKIKQAGDGLTINPDFSSVKSKLADVTTHVQSKFEDAGRAITGNLTKSFAAVGLGITAAVGTAVAGLASLTSKVGQASKELENQARLANSTTTEFQEWAFASKSVMVQQDKLSDIMKDVNDKFGDFMQTGGGEMADFFEKIAPKVKVTAKEFQGLSGPQILGKYYETLKKANVSQAEMTFYMESIANDATLLAPLLDNNAEKLKEYAKQAHELGVIMDQESIAKTKEFNSALGLIQSTFDGVMNRIAAKAAPTLTKMANDFLSFAAKSKNAIDGSISAIITIFESFFEIASEIFGFIGDVWGDLTKDIGDGSEQQITFLGMISGTLKGFATVVVASKVTIQSAFSIIRAVIVTACQAISISISTVLNAFGGFRDTIQFGLDMLGTKFKTFGNIVSNVLSFNFSGAKATFEQGLGELGEITERYTSKMGQRAQWLKQDWNTGVSKSSDAWGTAWGKIGGVSQEGQSQLSNLFLKNPYDAQQQAKVNQLNTFDPNRGVGTGHADDKKSGSKDSKYEPTTYSDLRIKSTEAYAGGKAHQGVLDLAGLIQDKFQITRFTAFNDNYHKGTSSKHAQGLALDFGLQDSSKSGQVTSDLRSMLGKNGVNAQVLDEYKNPSKRATGGHIHVSFNSQADADKYLALVKNDKVKGSKKSSSDSQYERYLEEQTRNAEKAEKERLDLKYKYASEQEKVQLELSKELDRIEKSTLNSADKKTFKEKVEKESQDKIVALNLEAFEKIKAIYEQEIKSKQDQAQRIYELEKVRIQAALDAGRISNVEKVQLEKQLEDQLYQIKRDGLLDRLDLENQQSSISGKGAGQSTISSHIAELDNQKVISDISTPSLMTDAQMKDFEKRFGGLTSRMSNLWDQGMQAMMNGTLTWRNALNAVFSELAMEFIQQTVTAPLKEYGIGLARRLALKFGFIKAETAAEVSGQAAQTTAVVAGEGMKTAATSTGVFARLGLKLMEVIKSIMMSAWEAMAAAWAALSAIPIVGPALGVAAGIAAFAGVSAIVGKVASARGGYDIPSGVNPMTQLHEEEMVLPKQHANTIRALGKSVMGDGAMPMAQASAGGGEVNNFNFQSWDSKDLRRFAKKHGREFVGGMKSYKRNFGK